KAAPPKVNVNGISDGSQAFILWRNRYLAAKHRSYTGDIPADTKKLADQLKGDASLAKLLETDGSNTAKEKLRGDFERFCSVFPWTFVVADRSTNASPADAGKGRPLTAGFHLMQGYFRDDLPLCELILSEKERHELDTLWFELDFIT